MSDLIYNWKRYWCPKGVTYQTDGLGYPAPPSRYNANTLAFGTIAKAPCLIMLGEPGMGKSFVLENEQQRAEAATRAEGNDAILVDLRQYGTGDEVRSALFRHPSFLRWASGTHRLEIFLDSLDECRLRVETIASLLVDSLKDQPAERLSLRITCRTADWSNLLERGLRKQWGEDSVKAFELLPLTREDVGEAATANGLEADRFLRDVESRDVVPLATRPTTLKLLLRLYKRDSSLPSTQAGSYSQGCVELCAEVNESRIDSGRTGSYTAEQRMSVAARVAAVMAFSKRAAVWKGAARGDAEPEGVSLSELRGGYETAQGERFLVNDVALRETLGCGLFSARVGADRLGWTHATYGEFLAAWYLVERDIAPEQAMRLITHPDDPQCKLVPQLYDTAAWLAGMSPEIFRYILHTDPKVLLRVDEAAMNPDDRASLVAALLKMYDHEGLHDDWQTHRLYRKLAHPSLASQLEPYIRDRNKSVVVRRVAIEIAEVCQVRESQNLLADITLDNGEPLPVRISAAGAIAEIGDRVTRLRLKPIATNGAVGDTRNELRGYSLMAVYPEHMTADEMFSSLVSPQDFFHGAYDLFLSQGLVSHLGPSDLPTALHWVEALEGRRKELPHAYARLMTSIMLRALEYVDAPGVLDALADAALARLMHYHDHVFGMSYDDDAVTLFDKNEGVRRRVLEALFKRFPDPEENWTRLIYARALRVEDRDVPWMLELFEAGGDSSLRKTLSVLIPHFFIGRSVDPDNLEVLYSACQRNPIVNEALGSIFDPVEIESADADQARRNWATINDFEERRMEPEDPGFSVSELILRDLDEFEAGNVDAWWHLNYHMFIKPGSRYMEREDESDLTATPGWQAADELTRSRIIGAAPQYIREGYPRTPEWIGSDGTLRPADAGYRALRLLLEKDPPSLSALSADVWRKWSPIVLLFPVWSSGDADKEAPHRTLIQMAYRHAPEPIIEALLIKIDKANREGSHLFLPSRLKYCWDERMGRAVMERVKDVALKPQYLNQLLDDLLEYGIAGAQEFAETLVTSPPPADGKERERALIAARSLVRHAHDCGWSVVRDAMNADMTFGRELVESTAGGHMRRSIGDRLAEGDVADLYLWLVHEYPPAEDPKIEGMHTVTTRESIGQWRDSLLQHLKLRGTHEACHVIERLMSELPELQHLQWVLREAEEETRRHTWVPPSPAEVINLAHVNERDSGGTIRANKFRQLLPMTNREQIFQCLWVLHCGAVLENVVIDGDDELTDTCGQGTAFTLAGVGVVTCQHVLCPHTVAFRAESPAKWYKIELVMQNEALDLALIRIAVPQMDAGLERGDATHLEPPDEIAVAGFPNWKLGASGVVIPGHVVGDFMVSGIRRRYIDAAIIAGNSGGPVLDDRSRVVGVAVTGAEFMDEARRVEHGVIPISALDHLHQGRRG